MNWHRVSASHRSKRDINLIALLAVLFRRQTSIKQLVTARSARQETSGGMFTPPGQAFFNFLAGLLSRYALADYIRF